MKTLEDKILEYLKDPKRASLLNLAQIEASAGIPKTTLSQCLNGKKKLPRKHTRNLVAVLKGIYPDFIETE